MGTIRVQGSAQKEFAADSFRLHITVSCEVKDSQHAVRNGHAYIERLLTALAERIGLEPEELTLGDEGVRRSYGEEPRFSFTKSVTAVIPGSLTTLRRITEVLESAEQTEYSLESLLSTRADAEKDVLRAAVADSRAKAELLAEAMGMRITGADSAELDFPENAPTLRMAKCEDAACGSAMSDRLQNPVIRIEKHVSIAWLTEPAE